MNRFCMNVILCTSFCVVQINVGIRVRKCQFLRKRLGPCIAQSRGKPCDVAAAYLVAALAGNSGACQGLGQEQKCGQDTETQLPWNACLLAVFAGHCRGLAVCRSVLICL